MHFSLSQAQNRKRYRITSALNIADEIEYRYVKGNRQFNFLDDNFTLQKHRFMNYTIRLKNGKKWDIFSLTYSSVENSETGQ